MTRKLTRQERKEALAWFDQNIAICEAFFDQTKNVVYRHTVNDLQTKRAARLNELENNTDAP